MLEEAVSKLKGEERVERPSVQMSLGIALRIDESYIAEENQRLRMYKRIAGIDGDRALEEVRAELQDRYGPLPTSVEHLLQAARLRIEKRGAQFTPQGLLRFPLKATKPNEVLAEVRALLEELALQTAAV